MAKILLVEDDKSLREIYGVRLMAEGYEIVSAGDGEEALALAIKERPDLIVSDVMMPKISGFDMLDILRSTSETKDVKVIMMTALSSDDQRARGESLGADRYLVKSQVGIEDVVRTVHDVLGDGLPGATAPAAAIPTFPATTPFAMPTPAAAPAPVANNPEPVVPVAPAPVAPMPEMAPLPPAPVAPPMPDAPNPAYGAAEPAQPAVVPAPAPVEPVAPVPAAPAPIAPPAPVAADPMPAPQPQPVAMPAPTPVPAPPLPQPTAPFSSPAPASLGQRIIEPLTAPTTTDANGTPTLDIAAQMQQALNTPVQPPVPPTDQQLPPQQ